MCLRVRAPAPCEPSSPPGVVSRSARRAKVSEPHPYEIGRWVRLLAGPSAGKLGQIVWRYCDELDLLVNGGPYGPVSAAISEVHPVDMPIAGGETAGENEP